MKSKMKKLSAIDVIAYEFAYEMAYNKRAMNNNTNNLSTRAQAESAYNRFETNLWEINSALKNNKFKIYFKNKVEKYIIQIEEKLKK